MTLGRPRILLIDDGDVYGNAIETRMPEFELIQSDAMGRHPGLPDGPAALAFLAQYDGAIDVVLLDMHFDVPEHRLYPLEQGVSLRRTRRFQGVAILRKIRELFPHLPVVLLTAFEDLSLVDAADDLVSQSMTYILDSTDLDTLKVRIHAAIADATQDVEATGVLWGNHPAMKKMSRRLRVLAKGGMPIILEGETGTGKSYLAEKFIHVNSGRSGPFVVLDLSTVPANLISAHLFGSEKGAYTGATERRKGVFEIANGGTLFIDEIQNAPLDIQKQLLLVLQDKKIRPLGASHEVLVDVRVVAASNEPLANAVVDGRFRRDLYMRLSPATKVVIPPLRERLQDLQFLAQRFLKKASRDPANEELKKDVADAVGVSIDAPVVLTVGRKEKTRPNVLEISIPEPAWKLMTFHQWPGNMRELEMVVANLLSFTLVDVLDAINRGVLVSSNRINVDTGLLGQLITEGALDAPSILSAGETDEPSVRVSIEPQKTLNEVSREIERQCYLDLYFRCKRDFGEMAYLLLGDREKSRAVRLRFNQLGLKVREIQ